MLFRNGVLCIGVLISGASGCNLALAQQGDTDAGQRSQSQSSGSATNGQNVTIEIALIAKLRKGNDAEIALGQLAQQRSKNPDVKSVAEHMIRDHQNMNQQLQQLSNQGSDNQSRARGASGSETDTSDRASSAGGASASGRDSSSRDPGASVNEGNPSRTAVNGNGAAGAGTGRGGAGAASGGTSQSSPGSTPSASGSGASGSGTSGAAVSGAGVQASGSITADGANPDRTGRNTGGRSNSAGLTSATVPVAFWQVIEQTCDNELAMTKDALAKLDGHEFDLAYLGQQKVAHVHTLAELTAIESAGPSSLKQTASTTKAKVNEHLTHIKQTMDKMKDGQSSNHSDSHSNDRGNSSRATPDTKDGKQGGTSGNNPRTENNASGT